MSLFRETTIDVQTFLAALQPALESGDADAVASAARQWSPRAICGLLRQDRVEARRLAAMTLSLVGDHSSQACLAAALRDEDDQVADLAEHALWTLWFRLGSADAARLLHDAVNLIEADRSDEALRLLDQASGRDPFFAEVHHQAGLALHLLGRYREAIHRCCFCIRLQPEHFAAIAQLGHGYVQLGDRDRALRCYRRALRIHPRLETVAETVRRLRSASSRPRPETTKITLGAACDRRLA